MEVGLGQTKSELATMEGIRNQGFVILPQCLFSSQKLFDDLIWDEFEESTDDMVQEPYEDDKHTTWATENDARRTLQQEPSIVLVKNLGFISQCSGASSSFVIPNTEGRQQSDVGSKPGLQS
ncbi:unnamed protein product [Sphagnum balticum]